VTATIGTLAGKQTDPVGPPRVKPNRQSARPPVKRTPFDTTLLVEHRSTTERAHRAALAAKDATIAQQRYEITDLRRRLAEREADAYRLCVSLPIATGQKSTLRAGSELVAVW
jgi:hypothetical protein